MTESNDDKKRASCKRRHPNQRYHELLETLLQNAVRGGKNRLVSALKQAISSLEKYPLPLSSGQECAILKGFDRKLCKYIDIHTSESTSKTKKTKVQGHEHNNEGEEPGPSNVDDIETFSDTEMPATSKKNRKKIKQLITNTEKCPFSSQFGEPSNIIPDVNNKNLDPIPPEFENVDPIQQVIEVLDPVQSDDVNLYPRPPDVEILDPIPAAAEIHDPISSDCEFVCEEIVDEKLEPISPAIDKPLAEFDSKFPSIDLTEPKCTNDSHLLIPTINNPIVITEPATSGINNIQIMLNTEKNNNTKKSDCRDEMCTAASMSIHPYNTAVNRRRRFAASFILPNDKLPEECIDKVNFAFCEDWEPYNSDYPRYKKKYDADIKKCYKEVQVVDPLEDSSATDSSVTEVSSGDECDDNCPLRKVFTSARPADIIPPAYTPQTVPDLRSSAEFSGQSTSSGFVSISQPSTSDPQESASLTSTMCCLQAMPHFLFIPNDKENDLRQFETITTAADAFQLYFKDKMKRDAQEIENCVLTRKLYKPAYRSGEYAMLIALLEQRNECPFRDCLTKDELIQKAQKHTDQSFTSPMPHSKLTAWMNIKRLINKDLVQPSDCEHQSLNFMLTTMGKAVASELLKEHTPEVTINDVIFQGQRNDRVPSIKEKVVLKPAQVFVPVNEDQSSVFIEMLPGMFDIVMLIDKRERYERSHSASPNGYCRYEYRSLNIGDFIWVARSKKTGQELVLPYIVERKTMEDLASSIKDGRYHEQKFRLRKCGLKNILYLVENDKKNKQSTLPVITLTQALENVSIQDEFNVVRTISLEHTFNFLGMYSEKLVRDHVGKFMRGCNRDTLGKELMTFEFFNKFSCKNKPLTVKDTFIKMLLQLKGLSVEKALAITKKYNSPYALMSAYENCTEKEGELLLSRLKFNCFAQHVGPVVSKTIYKLFSKLEI